MQQHSVRWKLAAVLVGTNINGKLVLHDLALPAAATLGDAPNGEAFSGQVVRIYADPNTVVNVEAAITGAGPATGCGFSFSGEQSPVLPP